MSKFDQLTGFISDIFSSSKESGAKKTSVDSKETLKKAAVPNNDDLTPSQRHALDLMVMGSNVFITGGAGTGKSFLLRRFLETRNDVLVTAPTGVAARNVGGTTLHRAFKLPIGIISDSVADDADDKKNSFISKANAKKRRKLLKACNVLVIDEISMCRADAFAYIADMILSEERRRHHIQVILCGDFAQLPPVISKKEQDMFSQLFPDNPRGWAFITPQWQRLAITTVELKEIVRQKDANFAMALNDLRRGNAYALNYVNSWHCRDEISDAVTICGTNKAASEINNSHLEQLSGSERVYRLSSDGEVKNGDISCETELALKVGAKVIILVNDLKDNLYQNGSFGTITDMLPDSVTVRLEDTGRTVEICKNTWEIYGYDTDEITQTILRKTIGTYTQLPLRLGWAVTVHKSQGATYKAVNLIPQAFWETGQLYVALSRCVSLNTLYFPGNISRYNLKTSSEFLEYFGA